MRRASVFAVVLGAAIGCTRATPATPPRHAAAPAAAVLHPLPVGGDVQPPVPIVRIEPKLPQRFTRPGLLMLAAIVDRTGAVRDVRVVRDGTIPKVGGLYADAIRQWRFKPGTLYGRPVDVEYNLSVIIDVR